MKKEFVPVEAIKIVIDRSEEITTTSAASNCWAYVMNELENHQCTTQDEGKVGVWVKPSDSSYQVGC